ncbi:MAG: EamA family transporter [Clostridia bacterium]|nr:EamA family transporter [Clostridia bacterium]
MAWIWLVLFYGTGKGVRDAFKKKALTKSGTMEVLFFYTALSFLLTIPFAGNIFGMPKIYYLYIFGKSFVIFLAWICSFRALTTMPISLYGVIDMSGVLFSTLLGVVLLGERPGLLRWFGLALVLAGLLILALSRGKIRGTGVSGRIMLLAVLSCLLNAVSGTLDKVLMKTGEITSGQLQVWYMFFLTLLYLAYILVSKTKIDVRTLKTNGWIVAMSVLFVVSDRALFIANSYADSSVTAMTLIKQSSVIMSLLLGKLWFKEKGVFRRALCALLIAAGIVLSVI